MQLINDTLSTLSLSTPQAFLNLAVFPLVSAIKMFDVSICTLCDG